MRGMGRVFKRKQSLHWWISYCHHGKEIRESCGSEDQKVAEKLLRHRLKEIGADQLGCKPFIGPKQERVTVAELLDDLVADYRIREIKSLASSQSHLNPVRSAFGHRRAVMVTSADIDEYIEMRRATKKANATINKETQLLSQAYTLAMTRQPPKLHVTPRIRQLPENNARQVFVENADFEAIVRGLPDYLQDFTRLGRLIAWRKGELNRLPWMQVDRNGKGIRLLDSKNGQGRLLPLADEAWVIIERRWAAREYRRSDGTTALALYVFHRGGRPIGDIRKAWKTACEAVGLKAGRKVEGGVILHDLRRTGIRNMIRAGVDETVAMKISGHRTRAVFDRYNITSEDDLREAVAKTQDYLKAKTGERKVAVLHQTADAGSVSR